MMQLWERCTARVLSFCFIALRTVLLEPGMLVSNYLQCQIVLLAVKQMHVMAVSRLGFFLF